MTTFCHRGSNSDNVYFYFYFILVDEGRKDPNTTKSELAKRH